MKEKGVKGLVPRAHHQEVAEPPNHIIRKVLKQTAQLSADSKPQVLLPPPDASYQALVFVGSRENSFLYQAPIYPQGTCY